MKYDQNTCLTAGYLRSIGVPLPDSIADRSFIPRSAVQFESGGSVALGPSWSLVVCYPMRATFTEPFLPLP